MSLKKYIDEEFPKNEKENVLKSIKKWLGDVELEDGMEKNPMYKTVIIGAINLMRHTAFEWIKPDDIAENIGNRWHQIHLENKNKLSYGIRFSTSEQKMITLGFFYTFFDKKDKILRSDYYFVRYEILDNFMFKEKRSELQHSFAELLTIAVDYINQRLSKTFGKNRCERFEYYDMRPLNLNVFPLIMEKLDYYITENHLTMYGYTIDLRVDDEQDNTSYLQSERQELSNSNLTKKTLKQGSRVWSYSPPKE